MALAKEEVLFNIINFEDFRNKKYLKIRLDAYKKIIQAMPKEELLEEMVRFSEKQKDLEFLKKEENLKRAFILFQQLNITAESDEMKAYSKKYLEHLKTIGEKASG